MINFCGMSPANVCSSANGKTHCRQDELIAHRNTIRIANEMMVEAAGSKDYEAVNKWSEMIDFAQKKVFEIINQEDIHAQQRVSQIKDVSDMAFDVTDKVVKTGSAIKLFA